MTTMCSGIQPLIVFILMITQAKQLTGKKTTTEINSRCRCMEYWECFRSGGNFSSYCGLSESEVCCKLTGVKIRRIRNLQSKCGRKGKDNGKIGFAEPTEWPWHAAILEKANHIYICGASVIDENWVLTAAHCVDDFVADNGVRSITARLGEYDVRSNAEFHRHEEYDVAEIIVHPAYNRSRILQNDIALLRLRFPVQRKPNIDVVCIPKLGMNFEAKKSCFVTGWGRRTLTDKHASILKEVKLPIWPSIRCDNALKTHFGEDLSMSQTIICAGAEGSDACDGDGGGPLVCEDSGQWYQTGIVSFGLGCGEKDTPGVYTNVIKYEKWIWSIILQSFN